MALNKAQLAATLEATIKQIDAQTDDTRKLLAEAIANDVIDHFIANAVITVATGIAVQVTPATGTGTTIAPGTGTIA